MADPILAWTQSKQKQIAAFLRELVECESPTDDPAAVTRFTDLFRDRVQDIGAVRIIKATPPYGPHLQCEFDLPGGRSRVRSWRWATPIPCIRWDR